MDFEAVFGSIASFQAICNLVRDAKFHEPDLSPMERHGSKKALDFRILNLLYPGTECRF